MTKRDKAILESKYTKIGNDIEWIYYLNEAMEIARYNKDKTLFALFNNCKTSLVKYGYIKNKDINSLPKEYNDNRKQGNKTAAEQFAADIMCGK